MVYVWQPRSPQRLASLFDPLGIRWWIAGGIAIDLFAGRKTREHGDIDVAVLRRDTLALAPLLTEWDVCVAHDGELTPWNGDELAPEMHQFWARPRGSDAWAFEILLEVSYGSEWHYRRDGRIHRSIASIGRRTPEGLPYLTPEICLLYKAPRVNIPRDAAERNAADFETVLPLLDETERLWLQEAFAVIIPDHPWIRRLHDPNGGATAL